MARCPDCKARIDSSVKECPYCGKELNSATLLEKLPDKTTTWQKILIILAIIILIAIAFTFMGAEKREDAAAQRNFNVPISQIIDSAAAHSGLGRLYGMPEHRLDATPKTAEISIVFPGGPLNPAQAQAFASHVAGMAAREYVRKGYMPRQITVAIASRTPDGRLVPYGKALYNGDKDFISWQGAGR